MPSPPVASPALRKLLETKLDTFEKLELVLVLRAAGAPMALVDAARELQVGPDVLRRVALEVQRGRLVEVRADDHLRLTASAADLEALAQGAELFARDRGAMFELMSAVAMNRLRSMAARTFADAFRIRKKEDDNG